jgi:two-component system, NtrC family, response regulator HydG
MSACLRVLVVDDDHDLAETIEDILSGWGHEVTVAHDGEQAVRLFREGPFDLCFMDVRLPGVNGVDSLLEIRRFRPEAKIVIMTAYSVEDLLARAVDGGAMAVLHKPLATEAILEAIEQAGARGVVLVVDDDGDFAESLKEALWSAGYSAVIARDGGSVLATLQGQRVDVMVLDLRLPVRSGLEVCQELKRAGLAVPTVVVTGYASEEAGAIEALKAHQVSDVLVKPVDVRALLRAVDDARRQAPARG